MSDKCLKKVFITGGAGFLAKTICKKLIEQGVEVHSYSRKNHPELHSMGVICHQGDLADYDVLLKSIPEHIDCVFHTAALTDMWGKYETFYKTNVLGTQNILKAIAEKKIYHLIYTSTPSVVFNENDLFGVNENEITYPEKFLSYYAQTKSIAERMVLRANCVPFYTCALRPHLIWGPNDPSIRPRLIQMALKKRLKIIGRGQNLVDVTYCENAANAHLLAAYELMNHKKNAGKAYFLGDEKPVELWPFIYELLGKDYQQYFSFKKKIPTSLAYFIGYILEKYYQWNKIYHKWPMLTRFAVLQMSKSHYFSHKKAQEDFNYQPIQVSPSQVIL